MKKDSTPRKEGAALVTALVIISVISIIVVSLLAITDDEIQISNYQLKSTEARLAANAGFEDACNLLAQFTSSEDYLITSKTRPNTDSLSGNGDGKVARYTFISQMENGEVRHIPMFTGGTIIENEVPNISDQHVDILLSQSPIAPRIEMDGEVDTYVKTFGLSHLDNSGEVQPETTSPLIGQFQIPKSQDKAQDRKSRNFAQRYAFWIEDLEAYPAIDPANKQDNNGIFEYAFLANGSDDQRIRPASDVDKEEYFAPLYTSRSDFAAAFPLSWNGQQRFGAVAPGLSPKEYFLHAWDFDDPTSQYDEINETHPYRHIHKLILNNRDLYSGSFLSLAPGTENRFSLHLTPYEYKPLIPYNHGYSDEGEPKHQINRFVSDGDVEGLAEIITQNLPNFGVDRRGGFPDPTIAPLTPESYIHTIAANMIDYADEDHSPSVEPDLYRGIDGFLPANEIYLKIEYDGYIDDGSNFIARFIAIPYIEFWNSFNKPITMEKLKLKLRIVETFRAKTPLGSTFRMDGENNLTKDEAFDNPVTDIEVPPNGYKVVEFGKLEWRITIPKGPSALLGLKGVVAETDSKDTKFDYQLYLGGTEVEQKNGGQFVLIDRSSRPYTQIELGEGLGAGGANKPKYGIHMESFVDGKEQTDLNGVNGDGIIRQDEFIMRAGMMSQGSSHTYHGTFLGDPFMQYFARHTAARYKYGQDATPGARNYSHGTISSNSGKYGDVIRHQTRVRDWPDRGFDNELGDPINCPPSETKIPTSVPPGPSDPSRAPFRISNEGRYFSLTELGNIHDPVMWRIQPKGSSNFRTSYVSQQHLNRSKSEANDISGDYKIEALGSYPDASNQDWESIPDSQWGGGNTLRICRKEHALFDKAGSRACQLLDLFHVGENGTNLEFGEEDSTGQFIPSTSQDRYETFAPSLHFLPRSAPDEDSAEDYPFVTLFDSKFHAQGEYKRIHGHLNINTIPTLFEMECLLRGPLTMSGIVATGPRGLGDLTVDQPTDEDLFKNSMNPEAISEIAKGLMDARPFTSQSHLARVLNELVDRYGPDYSQQPSGPNEQLYFANDALKEELTSRVLNLTHLSSRHFRIFVQGEVVVNYEDGESETISRSTWVHEVFMKPVRDSSGEIIESKCEILSSREL